MVQCSSTNQQSVKENAVKSHHLFYQIMITALIWPIRAKKNWTAHESGFLSDSGSVHLSATGRFLLLRTCLFGLLLVNFKVMFLVNDQSPFISMRSAHMIHCLSLTVIVRSIPIHKYSTQRSETRVLAHQKTRFRWSCYVSVCYTNKWLNNESTTPRQWDNGTKLLGSRFVLTDAWFVTGDVYISASL